MKMKIPFLGQVPESDDHVHELMEKALKLFHEHKAMIVDLEAHQGKGQSVIEDWHIPKLELMQRVVPNIWVNGVAMQWNADHMEHAHITKVKIPARAGNMSLKLLTILIELINVTDLTWLLWSEMWGFILAICTPLFWTRLLTLMTTSIPLKIFLMK